MLALGFELYNRGKKNVLRHLIIKTSDMIELKRFCLYI